MLVWGPLVLACTSLIVTTNLSFPEKSKLLEGSPVPSSTLDRRVQVHLPIVNEEAPYKDGGRMPGSQPSSSLGGEGQGQAAQLVKR